MQSYLDELNDIQRQAVLNTEGPTLIIAGAGSGKTRVLTYRIAHLITQGVHPYKILALTFTNKAAQEMKARIANVVGPELARNLWMGTFHSVFARILRAEAQHLGYPQAFTIYDTLDSQSLIKSIIKQLNLDVKKYKPSAVYNRISSAKNELITPKAYAESKDLRDRDFSSQMPRIADIYKHYSQTCYRSGAMDFDDLLLNMNILFRDFPEVLTKYQKLFTYIMVDEYQDTNLSQYLIVKKLAQLHKNICVVGDDSQSIYSFRGARIENILNFRKDYPDFKAFKLEQNYRSTQNIVNLANDVISNNKHKIEKTVFSENDEGSKVRIFGATSDYEEAYLVANDILNLAPDYSYNDFAILYRYNAQSRLIEDSLRKRGIPYKIYSGQSFYQRKEIKDLLAYCRIIVNSTDDEALKRIINYPARGIGKTTFDKITATALEYSQSLWAVASRPSVLQNFLNKGTITKLTKFVALINSFKAQKEQFTADKLMLEVLEQSGMRADLFEDKSAEGIARQENIKELINGIGEFVISRQEEGGDASLESFVQEVALFTEQDTDNEDDRNKVSLMTIHSSKGLEYKNVYVIALEEGLFPSSRAMDETVGIGALEEERRLFYVALTRAEENATLTFSSKRSQYGEEKRAFPSRFIVELNQQYIKSFGRPIRQQKLSGRIESGNNQNQDKPSFSYKKRNISTQPSVKFKSLGKSEASQQNQPTDSQQAQLGNNSKLTTGNTVEHIRFGIGVVKAIEGNGPDTKATIAFNNVGTKQLLLKFAKLKVLK